MFLAVWVFFILFSSGVGLNITKLRAIMAISFKGTEV